MRQIMEQLRIHAACNPMRPAIILPDRVITYAMLARGVSSVQSTVSALNIRQNDTVGILVDNPARHLIIALALLKLGHTISSLRHDLLDVASGVGIAKIMTDEKIDPIPPGASLFRVDDSWFSRAEAESDAVDFPKRRAARVVFTSGSTGRPKAIAWSFDTLLNRIRDCIRLGIAASDRTLCCYGLSTPGFYFSLTQLFLGKTVVFSPLDEALSQIKLFCIDEVICSQSQMRRLLELHAADRQTIRISKVKVGCGQLSTELQMKIEATFGSEVMNTYSATEFGLAGLAAGLVARKKDHVGNCFLPLTRVEATTIDGAPLPVQNEGFIRVKSDQWGWPFSGEDSLQEPDRPEWIYTGDKGFMTADGLFVVTGRSDEIINDGGVKFSPEAMEEKLKGHPAISDLAIVRFGEQENAEPWIAVVPKRNITLDDIHVWLQENVAGELGGVRFRRLFIIECVPVVGNGKIARQQLREMLAKMK